MGQELFGRPLEVITRHRGGWPDVADLTAVVAEPIPQAQARRPEDWPHQSACAWVRQLYWLGSGAPPGAFAGEATQPHGRSVTRAAPPPLPPSVPFPKAPAVQPPTQNAAGTSAHPNAQRRMSFTALWGFVGLVACLIPACLLLFGYSAAALEAPVVQRAAKPPRDFPAGSPPPKEPLVQLGHTLPVTSAAYSPEGRRIVTASDDGTARVLGAATGRELLTLHGHTDQVLSPQQAVLDAGHAGHSERFIGQPPRPLPAPREVWINPPADGPGPHILQQRCHSDFVPQLSQTH